LLEVAIGTVTDTSPATSANRAAHCTRRRPSAAARGWRTSHRVCAWLLVALVAAPFTSPFSTCDVRGFASIADTAAVHVPPPLAPEPVLAIAHDTDTAPLSIEEEIAKDDALTAVSTALPMPPAAFQVFAAVRATTSVFRAPLVALRL
jgi:hypothetical protein